MATDLMPMISKGVGRSVYALMQAIYEEEGIDELYKLEGKDKLMSQDIAPLFSKQGAPKKKKSTLVIAIGLPKAGSNINDGKDTPLKRAAKAVQRVKNAPKPVKPAGSK